MTRYDASFYEQQSEGSVRSAQRILPALLAGLKVSSVVDVGCGVGTWLGVCRALGIGDVVGLDGDYVDRQRLRIPPEAFRPTDLTSDWRLERRFDLALCLEVAEHLAPQAAGPFVGRIVRLADAVLFSAAIPYQGGTGHLHENWPTYWSAAFAQHGYALYDVVRPKFWDDFEVEYWYRQNAFVFAKVGSDAAAALATTPGPAMPLTAVHPEAYLYAVSRATALSRRRVEQDIAYVRRVGEGKLAMPEHVHDLNGFPMLALQKALKRLIRRALPTGAR